MATGPTHATSYSPRKENLGSLLSLTNPSIIVPDWQRSFSWKSEHIEFFWNDLISNFDKKGLPASEYFLGSIVIVNDSEVYSLLDGQQRLATAAILISVFRDIVQEFEPQAARQLQDQYLAGYDYVNSKTIHKLRLNKYDREFFRRLVLDKRDADYKQPEATMASHSLLLKAREFFTVKIEEKTVGLQPKERFDCCMGIVRSLLDNMTVIAVYSNDSDSAADVFETLNDRGIGLSTPDLLRNLIIRRAADGQQETIVDQWQTILSFENDAEIKAFLRHYWISEYGDVKSQSLYREMKHYITENHIDSLQLTTKIYDAAVLYSQLKDEETDSKILNEYLSEINEFGTSSNILYPVLMGVIQELNTSEVDFAVETLLNIFVRYSIISGKEQSSLENILFSSVRNLRKHKTLAVFLSEIVVICPSDEETILSFKRLSATSNGIRRHILRRIEYSMKQTEENVIANASNVHVEHIYPQNPKLGEMLPDHDRIVNRIGNLTLLSARINKSIKNGSFLEKRPSFGVSEIVMTKALTEHDVWNLEKIENRQNDFAILVPTLWPIPIL